VNKGTLISATATANASRNSATHRFGILAALCLLMVACNHVATPQLTQEQSLARPRRDVVVAITNVTLIDVASGAHQIAMTVLMKAEVCLGPCLQEEVHP